MHQRSCGCRTRGEAHQARPAARLCSLVEVVGQDLGLKPCETDQGLPACAGVDRLHVHPSSPAVHWDALPFWCRARAQTWPQDELCPPRANLPTCHAPPPNCMPPVLPVASRCRFGWTIVATHREVGAGLLNGHGLRSNMRAADKQAVSDMNGFQYDEIMSRVWITHHVCHFTFQRPCPAKSDSGCIDRRLELPSAGMLFQI